MKEDEAWRCRRCGEFERESSSKGRSVGGEEVFFVEAGQSRYKVVVIRQTSAKLPTLLGEYRLGLVAPLVRS